MTPSGSTTDPNDASSEGEGGTSPETSGTTRLPDPEVCTRDGEYDELCVSMGQPAAAYQCFAPGGVGIPASCVVNRGTLIVCCPA